jgi:hypothetical protein
MTPTGCKVSIALLHYPVYDKNRQVVATALTNLDLHDIARAAKTFGLASYYVVTPIPDQRALASRIAKHWQDGWGATYNPKRKAALDLVRIVASLDEAVADLAHCHGKPVKLLVTGAKDQPNSVTYAETRELLVTGSQHYLILLGTGWGLTEEVFNRADYLLAPIKGAGDYNHLSVRSAASIILDRLLGERDR